MYYKNKEENMAYKNNYICIIKIKKKIKQWQVFWYFDTLVWSSIRFKKETFPKWIFKNKFQSETKQNKTKTKPDWTNEIIELSICNLKK